LATGLSERQIAELVEDDEVETGEEVGEPALPSGAALGLQTIDQVDRVEEAPSSSAADTAPGNGDRKMRFPGTGSADQNQIALLCNEVATGEITHQALIDRRSLEREVVDILRQRQLGYGHLISDGARLLLGDLGSEQLTDEALW